MNLDDRQKKAVAGWIAEGLRLSEIQSRLNSEFGVSLTYMEVRLLVDDLKLLPKDPPPKVDKPLVAPPTQGKEPRLPPPALWREKPPPAQRWGPAKFPSASISWPDPARWSAEASRLATGRPPCGIWTRWAGLAWRRTNRATSPRPPTCRPFNKPSRVN